MDPNLVTGNIIDAAIKVHTALGPGLLESAYEACLELELHRRDMKAFTQVLLPVCYQGITVELGYRVDLLVEDIVIVELKAVEAIHPIHAAQLLSYMKLSGIGLGLLLNFNVLHLKDGIRRFIL
jgi:GxxExxY protein